MRTANIELRTLNDEHERTTNTNTNEHEHEPGTWNREHGTGNTERMISFRVPSSPFRYQSNWALSLNRRGSRMFVGVRHPAPYTAFSEMTEFEFSTL